MDFARQAQRLCRRLRALVAANLVESSLAGTYIMSAAPQNRPRYRVVFGKDAQDLESKLNNLDFVPAGYTLTHLTFNSARAEYLVILEDDRE